MKTVCFLPLLLILSLPAFAQSKHPADSLEEAYKNARTDTGRVSTLVLLCQVFTSERNFTKALDHGNQALKLASEIKWKKGEARALGVSFLNQILFEDQIFTPAQVLDRLRNKILTELRQTGKQDESKDGMDISLIRLNMKTLELQWSGANNPLCIFQDGELKSIKADKQPIGYYLEMKPFTNHTLQLVEGNSFYLFSDGYADQFGGTHGKKFKLSALKELLASIQNECIYDQKRFVQEAFEVWRGTFDQVDDVCLIGVKLQQNLFTINAYQDSEIHESI